MIKIQKLNKLFDARAIAGLHEISFEIKKGEVMALMGPNGSGKTTLINIICGKLSQDSGTVEIKGSLRAFEEKEHLDQNVQRFLINSNQLDIDEDRKIQLARDLADIFEFTFQLRQNLSELSAGQKQKILLAAELVNSPKLLLLDEPFTHLDPHTRKEILNSLFEYIRRQEISLLWVTHDLEEATLFSDRICLLNFGKLEQIGTPLELVKSPRSLFTAKFIGFENFLSVGVANNKWSTPWGEYSDTNEAGPKILVIPPTALYFSDNGIDAKVEEIRMRGRAQLVTLKIQDKRYFMELSPQIECVSKRVKINLRWEECFLLPH